MNFSMNCDITTLSVSRLPGSFGLETLMKLTIENLAAEIFPRYLIYVFTSSLRNVSYKSLFFNTALQHARGNQM